MFKRDAAVPVEHIIESDSKIPAILISALKSLSTIKPPSGEAIHPDNSIPARLAKVVQGK
ncbi:MAG TPA: hypothetical protein PL085_04885 [Agriterribacter sp.]|nr:hypothetical protein [Agriterribacter sp.]